MVTRRDFLKQSVLALAAMSVGTTPLNVFSALSRRRTDFVTQRPPLSQRRFTSAAVEELIESVKSEIPDPKIAWMFENCFPNTLDTTVDFRMKDGRPDTFVITGDIDAMWLRDSGAQVWPYVPLCQREEALRLLIAGVINRQTDCILLDRYANAFTHGAESSEWKADLTEMKPYVHERKWEIDSLCYPVRLAYRYWKVTEDISVFHDKWQRAAHLIYQTFREQQRKDDRGPYRFQRKTERKTDTLSCDGWGSPVKPVGLIVSAFRPSDDSTDLGFLIPSNFFAVDTLRKIAEISDGVTGEPVFAARCRELAGEVAGAIERYGIVEHPKFGRIYAYEVDGFGNALFMDDANLPVYSVCLTWIVFRKKMKYT